MMPMIMMRVPGHQITFLGDPSGRVTEALGMAMQVFDSKRCRRMSMLVGQPSLKYNAK
jgi:peroxiredoxin